MIEEVCDIIGDIEIIRVHGSANFGPRVTPRDVVNEGVAKCAVGYGCGSTQLHILRDHRLITVSACLTKKGKRYARAMGLYQAWVETQ